MTVTEGEALPYRPCVGVMLLNREGLAFIGRRAERPGAPEGIGQWWQMPQGGIDDGEAPELAARRELEEETGVRTIRFLGHTRNWYSYDLPGALAGVAWRGRYRGQRQLWFFARFEGEDREIDLSPRPGRNVEFDAWKWVAVEQLPELVVPFKRPVYEGVLDEFRDLLEL